MSKKYHDLQNFASYDFEFDYVECMYIACNLVGLTDILIFCNGRENYQGEMDIHVEAKYNGEQFYFYLKQDYGSCSYCDWLYGSTIKEVIEEYLKNLKEAIGTMI